MSGFADILALCGVWLGGRVAVGTATGAGGSGRRRRRASPLRFPKPARATTPAALVGDARPVNDDEDAILILMAGDL